MSDYYAGDAKLRVVPDASRFLVDLENDLRRKQAEFAVDVTADTTRAAADIDAFVARQTGRDITVGVNIDRRRAKNDILDTLNKIGDEVGNAFSAVGSGLKFPVLLAGIGELPAATTAIVNLAGALQQLSGAGFAVPGIVGGIVSSVATVKIGISGLDDAFKALADSSDGTAESAAALDEQLAKLAPSAADFVREIGSIRPEFEALQRDVQGRLFEGLSDSIRDLSDRDLPVLRRGLGGIATSLNDNLRQLGVTLGSDRSQGLLDRILGNTSDAQARLSKAIDPFVNAIGTLTAAGTDALPRLADGFGGLSERFERFITAADDDGRIEKWINDGITGFGHLGESVLNIGKALGGLTQAAGGDGGLLPWLEDATGRLQTFLNSAEGQDKLAEWFEQGRRQIGELIDVAKEAGPALVGVFEAGKDAADAVVPAVRQILDIINAIPGGAETVVGAFVAWKAIDGVTSLLSSISNIGGGIDGLGPRAGTAARAISSAFAAIAIPAALYEVLNTTAQEQHQQWDDEQRERWATDQRERELGLKPEQLDTQRANERIEKLPLIRPTLRDEIAKGNLPGFSLAPDGTVLDKDGKPAMLPPGFERGGPTPSGRGPGPTGGWMAEVHDDEWVLPKHARAAVGDRALWALTEGRSFATGGFVDQFGNPVTPGPAPGPAPDSPIAPNPYQGGGVSGIANSFLSGLGGVAGNVSGLVNGLTGGATGAGGGAEGGGFNLLPGLAGLFQAGSNPEALAQWGSQTGDWLGGFAAKTLSSFGSTLYQGVLGFFGLENSILSPNNTYTRAAMQGAGFFLGDDGPIASLMSGGQGATSSRSGSTANGPTPKQVREANQSVTRSEQRIAEITTRIGELPSDAKQSQRDSLNNDLINARQDRQDAIDDLNTLQMGGYTANGLSAGGGQARVAPAGMQAYTINAANSIGAAFPQIQTIGGYRAPDGYNEHSSGQAADVMIPGSDPALGNQVASYALQLPGVDYVIWQQAMHYRDGRVVPMEDRGNATQNHMDHVHVHTTGGGYPQGDAAGEQTGMKWVHGVGGEAASASAFIKPLPPPRPSFNVPDVKPITRAPFPVAPPRPTAPSRPPAPPPQLAPTNPAAPEVPSAPPEPPPQVAPQIGGPAPTAAAPSDYNHNLAAVNTAISSTASTLGNIASTAISAAAAAGTFGAAGAMGGGALGSLVGGLFQQGGKIATNVANVASSFLVGNITPGTTQNAYGELLVAPQNEPRTAPVDNSRQYIFNGIDGRNVVDELRIKDAQDYQATLARFGG